MLALLNKIKLVKIMNWWVLAFIFILIPMAAQAEWLSFIGTAAKEGAEAYVHTIYINAVERQMVTIQFLLYAILVTVQIIVAFLIVRNFRISFVAATKDNVIKWPEGVLLGTQGFVTLILCIGLLWSAWFYSGIIQDGLNEIRDFKPLEYSTPAK